MKASQQVGLAAVVVETRDGADSIFRDLIVWQRSMQQARDIYQVTGGFPKSEVFGVSSQVRPAVSVPSKIAEGHGRLTDGGFRVFLAHARGSLFEVET